MHFKAHYFSVEPVLVKHENPPLPLPYPTSDMNILACARVFQIWLTAGNVKPSQSWLTVAENIYPTHILKKLKIRLKLDKNIVNLNNVLKFLDRTPKLVWK